MFDVCKMRRLVLCLLAATVGCGGPYKEPTIDDFNGKLVHKGQPVSFEADEKVVLRMVFHKNGERFGIPINQDGTFDIGWMPIGSYSAILERSSDLPGSRTRGMQTYNIPQELKIEDGQTQHVIELGDEYGRK